MNNPFTPLVQAYTKNKTLALIIVIIALGLLIYFEGENLINWIGTKLKGAGAAITNSGNQALGNQGNQSLTQAAPAIQNIGNYYTAIAGNASDPFNPALYTANSSASNLDFPTLQSVAAAVQASLATSFLGIQMSAGSATSLKAALAPCLTQTDVSNVCIVFTQFYTANMAYAIMRDYATNLSSLKPDPNDPSGNDNSVNLWACIQWVNSLPKS